MRRLLLTAATVFVACASPPSSSSSSSATDPSSNSSSSGGASSSGGDATSSSSSGGPSAKPEPPCTTGVVETCAAHDVRSYCVIDDKGQRAWRTETCASGGCFGGKCSPAACTDECALGESGPAAGTTCKLWDMKTNAKVDPDAATSLVDRARDYDKRLRLVNLPHGQVMNANYTDAALTQIAYYSGFRDAAIWTGSALAAASFNLIATRSADAEKQVQALVKTLHRSFLVSGDPGYLARVVIPKTNGVALNQANRCSGNDPEWHCNVAFEGQMYDWNGGTSRDQNTGVMLGYYVAYFATSDEATRAIIRSDVVTMARELVKVRKDVPARVKVNGVPLDKKLDLENVILAPSEMSNGKILIDLSTGDYSESGMNGMREFFPDFSVLVKQVIGINVPIKRPSSTIMLAAFIQMGIAMSADDPSAAMVQAHKELNDYYDAHADDWLSIIETWSFDGNCGKGYFANHIAFIMAYVYASLEKHPGRLARIRDTALDGKLWGALKGHKNSYFAFLWASTRPTSPKAETDQALAQLSLFQPGPRVRAPRDTQSLAKYMPHDTKCTAEPLCDTASLATDVNERVVDDFIWQRQPWALYDGGDAKLVYPGVDYLAAYWAARRYGFTTDDRPGVCARYLP